MKKTEKSYTRRFVTLGVFAALSVALTYVIHIPLLPNAPFLEYDPADIPILILSFAYGPWWGLLLTFVTSVIQGLTVSSGSGIWGILMHFLATGALCVTSGLIYGFRKTRRTALISLCAGTLVMVAVMIPLNYFITPLYMGAARAEVAKLLLPAIIPFNLLKGALNSAITFLIYKKISNLLRRHS